MTNAEITQYLLVINRNQQILNAKLDMLLHKANLSKDEIATLERSMMRIQDPTAAALQDQEDRSIRDIEMLVGFKLR